MNDYNFVGPYKEIAPLYIEYKKSLGFDSKSELAELKKMDKYFLNKNISTIQLTKAMVEEYASKKESEAFSTQAKRLSLLKQFAVYLKKMGYEDIYIHNIKIHKNKSNFRPYIYSQNELEMIFTYLDKNQFDNAKSINSCVLPIFIRVVFACGLRKNEAINLKNDEIDLEKRIIIINNGKGNVSRIVPMSESLANACKVYKSKFPNNKEFFFCNYKGQKLSRHITEHFQSALKELDILRPDGTPPRLHDLRFTFAVMALEKMDKTGQDLYTTLPILCKYLGHKNIEATEHYVMLVKDYFINITNKEENYYKDLDFLEEGAYNEK